MESDTLLYCGNDNMLWPRVRRRICFELSPREDRDRSMEHVLQLLSPYCDGRTALRLAFTCKEGAAHFANARHRMRTLRDKKLPLHPGTGIPRGRCAVATCTYPRAESILMDDCGKVLVHRADSLYCPRCDTTHSVVPARARVWW